MLFSVTAGWPSNTTQTRTRKRRSALSECSSALRKRMKCFRTQKGVPNMTCMDNTVVAVFINTSRRPIVEGRHPLNLPRALAISARPSTFSTSSSVTPLVLAAIQCTRHCLPHSISRLLPPIQADDVGGFCLFFGRLSTLFSDRRRHTTSLFGGHPFVDKDENNW